MDPGFARDTFFRAFLNLELYAQEPPKRIFRTRDPYELIFRYRDASKQDIPVGLYHGHIFFFSVPGVIDSLQFEDTTLFYPDFKGPLIPELASPEEKAYWKMDIKIGEETGRLETTNLTKGRATSDIATALIEFRLAGEQGTGEPWAFGGSLYEKEGTLIHRVYDIFSKFEGYRRQTNHTSRFLRPAYDAGQWMRRHL